MAINKLFVGLLFIFAGTCYASLAIDGIYSHTVGWLIEHKWVKQPPAGGKDDLKNILGRKPLILFYACILIIIGLFILWNRNN